jgi:hypothetical protein
MKKALLVALSWLPLMGLVSCAYFHTPTPWDAHLYVGDSKSSTLMRSQDPTDTLKCSDVRFDDMVCMSKAEFGEWIANYKAYRAQCAAPAVGTP